MTAFVWTDMITEAFTLPSVFPVTSIDQPGSKHKVDVLTQSYHHDATGAPVFTYIWGTGVSTDMTSASQSGSPLSALYSPEATGPPEDSLGTVELTRRILVGFLAVLLAVSIAVGNTMVILAVYRERQLRTITNFFIVSLACSDFLIGTVVLPFSIHMEMVQGYWPYGVMWCDLWHAFDILCCTASILNLCAIAGDRYLAITHPISYPVRMTKRTACLWIGIVWVCSAVISFPCILWWRAVELPHPPLQCIFPSNVIYQVTATSVAFYLPVVVMVLMYFNIYRTAVAQLRAIRAGIKRVKGANTDGIALRIHKGGSGTPNIDVSIQERSEYALSSQGVHGAVNRSASLTGKQQQSELSREHKAARTLGIVMGAFVVCWLPFFIAVVIASLCASCYFHPIIMPTVTWVGYVNSALNPIIYAFASRRFKNAFARMLCVWKQL